MWCSRGAAGAARSYAAVAAFAAVSRLVATLPVSRIESLVELGRSRPKSADEIELLAQRIERVLWHTTPVLRHTCLTRGLTRYYFLRRAGADVRLVFGVGQIEEAYAGHCWLLRDGIVYQEATDPALQFVDVITLPFG